MNIKKITAKKVPKKMKGFFIKHDKENDIYIVKDRHGYTVSSKPNPEAAIELIKNDRRYVKYQPSIGGLESKKLIDNNKDKPINKKKISKKMQKLNSRLKK